MSAPTPTPTLSPLPINAILPELLMALETRTTAVLEAPPGAGKTTRVPPALLEASWRLGRRILVLEPRRLAARAAAARMATEHGESVGQRFGYRIRLDSKISAATRVEVLTTGLYLRRLQADPELNDVAAVIFDEVHERGVDMDLALALTLEAQAGLRPDLRLLAMSATLDAGAFAALMGGNGEDGQEPAPRISSMGRAYPVTVRHFDRPPSQRLEDTIAARVCQAVVEQPGDVLVFLPGGLEIRRAAQALTGRLPAGISVMPLFGDLPAARQDEAIAPSGPGQRKVVLATSIAETSLTIGGVRTVIDSGLMRVPRFDPASGMTALETVKVTQDTAEQRRGRAGRVAAGECHRLWPASTHGSLIPRRRPEMLDADLAPMALELAVWGAGEGEGAGLRWLDRPPGPALAQARTLLQDLGALGPSGRITPHGQAMAELGLHPRLAHMLLRGRDLSEASGALACDIAAILAERDPLASAASADLALRLEVLQRGTIGTGDRAGALANVRRVAGLWRRQLGLSDTHRHRLDSASAAAPGLLLALAYPDRIAQRRPGSQAGSYRLANGCGAVLAASDPLARSPFLAVATLDGQRTDARIFLAAALDEDDLEAAGKDALHRIESVAWSAADKGVTARVQRRLGALVLHDAAWTTPPPEAVHAALLEALRQNGLDLLPWTPQTRQWQARVLLLRTLNVAPGDWPDSCDAGLIQRLDTWLAPILPDKPQRDAFAKIDVQSVLESQLDWRQRQALDLEAPTHITVPSGSRIPIDYSTHPPVLAVRLQEMFGLADSPRVAGAKVPLILHLLSPAHRVVQVTADLAGFWASSYAEVKRDLKGRYPRHFWPDNPLEAAPTARAKPKGQ